MYFTFVAPYFRSQMITQRDHDYIVKLDNQKQKDLPDRSPDQCAEVFLNLLTHISKDHTIQYILVLIDDILSVSLEKLLCYTSLGCAHWDLPLSVLAYFIEVK